jgi:signal recognition particle receptor subunit alpha
MNFSIVNKGGWVVYSTQDLNHDNIQAINDQLKDYLQGKLSLTVRKDYVLLGNDLREEKREKLMDTFISLNDKDMFTLMIPEILQDKLQHRYKKKVKNTQKKKNELDFSEETVNGKKFTIKNSSAEMQFTSDQGVKENNILGIFTLLDKKEISKEDLDPVMEKFRNHLISKNVARQISTDIVEKVGREIIGEKKSRIFQKDSIEKKLKNSLEEILSRILTPKNDIDLITDIQKAKKRPFTMAFVGVNGVGKSTNLSKVCFWLLQNRFRVLIAACDTFRSGAVEQLGVHVKNLKDLEADLGENRVELYNRGYGKDPASIAKEAIQYGKNNGFDVVLIDTAGRMQNNEPLMRALAKLVSLNNPDRILFVGEALVGNEAIDQLSKFNQALVDFSGKAEPRKIDGIILSKFDTIDDKVGAAINMTYTTGQPIYFVGTGQTYTDLRKLNVKSVVNSLLSK